jgi:hypothetical protein
MAGLDQLWGAVLDQFDVDLISQTVVLIGRVTTGSDAVIHRLELRDVSELRFRNSIPGPWDYAEITEAHLARSGTGGISIDLVLWSDDAGISVNAGSAIFDGSLLEVESSG